MAIDRSISSLSMEKILICCMHFVVSELDWGLWLPAPAQAPIPAPISAASRSPGQPTTTMPWCHERATQSKQLSKVPAGPAAVELPQRRPESPSPRALHAAAGATLTLYMRWGLLEITPIDSLVDGLRTRDTVHTITKPLASTLATMSVWELGMVSTARDTTGRRCARKSPPAKRNPVFASMSRIITDPSKWPAVKTNRLHGEN